MLRSTFSLAVALVAAAFLVSEAWAQDSAPAAHSFVVADDLEWGAFEPEGFPTGARISVVHGNPAVEGEPYTVRISIPGDYEIPPHWHSGDETLTVLSGTFLLAMGESRQEERLETFRAGDVLFIPAEHPHFGGAKGPTVVQLHGIGPFTTTVLEPVASGYR